MALRFIQRDFLGLREEMVRFMSEKLGDKWNDYSESDETMTLIELLAHCVSNLHFAYDNQKRETDIVTASFPRNVYAHAIRNGYKPSMFKAGKTWLNISFRLKENGVPTKLTSLPVSIIIPRYTQIKNQEGDICTTNRDFILPAGTSTFSIEVLSGEYAFEQFSKNDINDFNYVPLNRLNIAYGTTRMFYKNEEWTPVIDVFTDIRDSKVYSLEPNFIRSGIRNIIRFFSTWKSEITDSSSITLEYIQTMGANSNYEKDTFTSFLDKNDLSVNTVTFDDDIYDSNGNKLSNWTDIEVCFSQPKPFVNGQNFESIDVVKKSYIQSLRQTTSLVVLDDYYAFIALNGINDFYVTDWNKNKTEQITIEYPRDIKALKAEEDLEGHSIYSPENTTEESYWPTNVSYINKTDNITTTRKINGREIIIYKSFDVNVNDYSEYADYHWYKEWLRSSQLKNGFNSYNEFIPAVYIASPNRINNTIEDDKPVFYGNYDNAIRFCDTTSRLKNIEGSLISDPVDLNKLRVVITNKYHTSGTDYYNKIICVKYTDLVNLYNDLNFNSSVSFCSNVFKSYYKKNEITTIPFNAPPDFYNQTYSFDCNMADLNFSSKNKIYSNEFKEKLKLYYGDNFIEDCDENEKTIKNTLVNKINSIAIKISGIETPFYVPSNEWFDCFLIIDGNSYTTDENDNINEYKHCSLESPELVYSKLGYFNAKGIDDYIEDDNTKDVYGLPILKLYNTPEDKTEQGVYTKVYNKISLCFRKKTVDVFPNIGFGYSTQKTENILHKTNTEILYKDSLDNEFYIQHENEVYAPALAGMNESDKEKTSLFVLQERIPNVYLQKFTPSNISVYDDNYDYFDDNKHAYKVIHNYENHNIPLISAYDDLYHDDFVFDKTHLTAKPLNIHYYNQLLNQQGSVINDNNPIMYVEECLVDEYKDYSYTRYPTPTIEFDNEYSDGNSSFGFLRSGQTVIGKHNYDYLSLLYNVGVDNIASDKTREEHIINSFMIDIQLSYPRYLKYLILKICFVNDVDYTMTHEKLNKKLIELGYENILYALNKILSATVSISYWYTDKEATIGKQYSYSPNENKRYLACGGNTSWSEDDSPSKNYFHWNLVYPEIVELYQQLQQKQGRGDAVYILPFEKSGVDIHAHIYIQDSTSDVASVFENIWNAIVNYLGLLKNIEDIKYISEVISVIQSADGNILKICTLNEKPYSGTYIVVTPEETDEENIFITDVSKSSVVDFYHFLKFIPTKDIQPESNLGHSLVLGNLCIRLQKTSDIENIVYHFERSGLKPETTLAYKLKQVN